MTRRGSSGEMIELKGDSGRDTVDVHNRLDKVVLVVAQYDGAGATTTLTAAGARHLAQALREAADTAERTPGS